MTDLWPVSVMPLIPGPSVVAVYAFELDQPRPVVVELQRLLSGDEIDRADRFATRTLRDRYIVGRAGLRLGLAAALDKAPVALRFDYGTNGKPALVDEPEFDGAGKLHFNLSHSGGRALLAVAVGAGVGVDIELVRSDIEVDDLAGRFFSPRERAAYRAFPQHERAAAFFRCWTRKEAIIKAVGDGLGLPLDSFDVDLDTYNSRVLRFIDQSHPDDWSLLHLDPAADYVGAVAVRAPSFRAECRSWDVTAGM